jgi:hypothetical protein
VSRSGAYWKTAEGFAATSGSTYNKTSDDSWPELMGYNNQTPISWRPSLLRQEQIVKIPANYGLDGSQVRWYARGREFAGIGNMPGPIPSAHRPTYNNMESTIYRLKINAGQTVVPNAGAVSDIVWQPLDYPAAQNASLTFKG